MLRTVAAYRLRFRKRERDCGRGVRNRKRCSGVTKVRSGDWMRRFDLNAHVPSVCAVFALMIVATLTNFSRAELRSEFIYDDASAPTPSCHASTIAQTKEGLAAAWFGGTAEGNRDVGI